MAAALFAALVIKDLLLFPAMRRFYEAEPVGFRMIGENGTAVTALSPEGLVRVRGELWKARGETEQEIPPGAPVCVREVDGLTLVVALVRRERPREAPDTTGALPSTPPR